MTPPEQGPEQGEVKKTRQVGGYIRSDWQPTEADIAWVRQRFPEMSPGDVKDETEQFVDYWCGEAGQRARKRDWSAAWKNWIRIANKRKPRGRPPQNPEPKRDALLRRIAELGNEFE